MGTESVFNPGSFSVKVLWKRTGTDIPELRHRGGKQGREQQRSWLGRICSFNRAAGNRWAS